MIGTLLPLLLGGALTLQPSAARTHVLIVAGIGGEARYSKEFVEAGRALHDAFVDRFGLADSSVVFLAEDPSRAPAIDGRSTKEEIGRVIAALGRRAAASDQLLVILIGHGARSAREPTFNLPGRDLSASDLAAMLVKFPARRIAIINAASASGEFIPVLAGEGRIVITATKSSAEGNETRFAVHLADAFARDVADTDKNGALTLLEVFQYARGEVVRSYERDNRLLTEHALLEDDGDGRGIAAPDAAGEGRQAHAFTISATQAAVAARAAGDPVLAELYATRDSLQRRLEGLRTRKASLPTDDYERQLEALLVEIAVADRAIRARTGQP